MNKKVINLFNNLLFIMLKTGIPKLDDLLEGGIKNNKSILFYSEPGVESIPFAFQLVYTRLQQGDHVLYFVNDKKPETVRLMMKSHGWDISEFEKDKKFAFFDAYSGLLGLDSGERFSVKDVKDMAVFKLAIVKALEELKNKNTILLFDSLVQLIDSCGDQEELLSCFKDFFPKMKDLNATPVFVFTAWAYDEKFLEELRNSFDCVIDLKAVEKKVIIRTYFSVSKAGWLKDIRKHDVPFKIVRPGGVRIYIPKVLVIGPYHAGKTSFIHSASSKAVSVERLGTTVALDHGHVDFEGFSVDLWGTPGQERFNPILELLGSESLGVIIVIDSTDPDGFVRAAEMLEITKTEGLPSVIVANKSNLKGALKPGRIRDKMKIPKEIPIISVVAEDLKKVRENKPCKLRESDVHKVLSKLFEMVV